MHCRRMNTTRVVECQRMSREELLAARGSSKFLEKKRTSVPFRPSLCVRYLRADQKIQTSADHRGMPVDRLGDGVLWRVMDVAQPLGQVAALARADEVLVSSAVVDLVAGSGITFEDRGEHALKGVPGTWRLFAVAVTAGGTK